MGHSLKSVLSRRVKSFGYAFSGWWYVIRTQPHMWVHLLAGLSVAALAWWLELAAHEWAILVLVILIVWITEMINTAIEAIVDMVMPDHHPLAEIAKDVAAAAVLSAAGGSVIIGLLILGPPLWQRFFG